MFTTLKSNLHNNVERGVMCVCVLHVCFIIKIGIRTEIWFVHGEKSHQQREQFSPKSIFNIPASSSILFLEGVRHSVKDSRRLRFKRNAKTRDEVPLLHNHAVLRAVLVVLHISRLHSNPFPPENLFLSSHPLCWGAYRPLH